MENTHVLKIPSYGKDGTQTVTVFVPFPTGTCKPTTNTHISGI
jgi:hypothetical protein